MRDDLLGQVRSIRAAWRAEHLPSPLAPPPGLSRLQRERMEKKARKGTLRAAA
jgi:hypothetical protein